MAEQWMAEQYAQIVLPSIVLPIKSMQRRPLYEQSILSEISLRSRPVQFSEKIWIIQGTRTRLTKGVTTETDIGWILTLHPPQHYRQ